MSRGNVVSDTKIYGENLRLLMSGITARGKITIRELARSVGCVPSTIAKLLSGNMKRVDIQLQRKIAEYFNVRIIDLWTEGIYSDGVFNNINVIGAFGDPIKRPVYDSFKNGAVNAPVMTFATFSGAEIGWIADRDMQFDIKQGDIVVFNPKYREYDLCIVNYDDEIYVGYLNFLEQGNYVSVIIRGIRGEIVLQARNDIRVLGRLTEVRHVFPDRQESDEQDSKD